MRLVLATHGFRGFGGSETYLLTVARQLLRLGHEVTIYAHETGAMSDTAIADGVAVATTPEALPASCDAVVSQDGVVAHELAAHWPATPQVFVAHSDVHDVQLPPVTGIAGAVVVLSDRVGRRVAAMAGDREIVRLRQPIDTERLTPRGAPGDRPRRAVLLGNHLGGSRRALLQAAWGARGIECRVVGVSAEAVLEPAAVAAADIVVGKGRVVLEALAWGRPAYVFDAFGGDGWLTPANYAALEADAFGGLADERPVDRARLTRDLDAYDPELAIAGRELVVRNHGARRHAEALVALAERVEPRPASAPSVDAELARLTALRWSAEREAAALRDRVAAVEAVAAEAAHDAVQARAAASGATELAIAREAARADAERGRVDAIAWAERTEARLAAANELLGQRRVRAALAIGRAADRVRRRGRA